MKRLALATAVVLAACVAALSAATIQQIRLAEGYDDVNRIGSPVYENAGLAVDINVTADYDRKPKFVRRTGGRLPATRGPEYDLNASVDLAALLTESLRSEAAAMGLSAAGGSGSTWRVTGSISDIYLESRQVYMGATLFYGYMELGLKIQSPSGESHTRRLRMHNYSGGYNAGMGRRDEAEGSAAHLLVEGAQEMLARLNREFFKAPPHRDMTAKLARLQTAGVKGNFNDLRMVGLSGLSTAATPLIALLAKEKEESGRAAIVDALAHLGSPEAVAALSTRYATEDEDVRWYTLKAMDAIGGEAAEQVVKTSGMNDEDAGPKRLAQRVSKASR
jgi:hypothetical protein